MKNQEKISRIKANYLKILALSVCLASAPAVTILADSPNSIFSEMNTTSDQSTLRSMIKYIEENSNYMFIYQSGDFNLDQRISNKIDLKKQPIREVLDKIFAETDLTYTIEGKQIIVSKKEKKKEITLKQSKGITISGTVRDENGSTIIGANVIVDGTINGTVTDVDGHFSLDEVNPSAIINISYIGYFPLKVKAESILDIVLREDNNILNEVVVVGYGNMTRKDITSSITTIKSDNLNLGVYSSPAQLLQGKVPGLTITQSSDPNAAPSVTLRGASTLRTGAAMEPYYVIDGIPGVSLAMIAPDDIESIDVLRDASATAIYGSKAANGVIIVTTKREKGDHSSVSYNTYVAFDRVAKNLEMMSGDEYRSYVLDNGFSMEPSEDFGVDTDWQKEVQRTGISTNHNISISGGSERTSYNASINYTKNEGVIKGTDMERFIGRSFVETKALNDRLKLSFNVNASITKQNDVPHMTDGKSVYDAMNYFLPYSPIKKDDGTWFENTTRSQYYNPVALIEENTDFTKIKRLQGIGKASIQILPELTYDIDLSYQNEQFLYNKYFSNNSRLETEAKAIRTSVENEKKTMEMYFNYNKTFNNVHKVGAMLGYSWEESNDNDGFRAAASGFYDDTLLYYNLGMGNTIVPDTPGNEDSSQGSFGNYYLSTLRMISLFGRINYSYASKYLFQATLRRDGSSAFGKNNRWATFPSASVAWRVSEEPFIKDLNIFDDLKLRTGYGISGNSLGFDAFTAILRYGATGWYTNSDGNQAHTLGPIANANPNLKWEKTGMLNVGLDFGFFKNRLSGTIEWYKKNTKDLIYNYTVSTTQYLYNTMIANVGEISNKGIELTINAIPVQTKNFSWSTSLNLSHNKNVVEKISNSEFSVDYIETANLSGRGQSDLNSQRIMAGSPIGQFYTWEWAGYNEDGISIFNDYDENGSLVGTTLTPDKNDQRRTGSAQPKLTMGWNNSFSYKNITLTAFFQGVFGNKILNGTRARYSDVVGASGSYNLLKSVVDTEKPTDDKAHYLSDRYLEKGDYLRLSSLTLAYDFHNLGNWVKNLRLYINCNNVFTLTDYKGLDPEVYLGGLTPGIDNRQTYPKTRTFMLGANINF